MYQIMLTLHGISDLYTMQVSKWVLRYYQSGY